MSPKETLTFSMLYISKTKAGGITLSLIAKPLSQIPIRISVNPIHSLLCSKQQFFVIFWWFFYLNWRHQKRSQNLTMTQVPHSFRIMHKHKGCRNKMFENTYSRGNLLTASLDAFKKVSYTFTPSSWKWVRSERSITMHAAYTNLSQAAGWTVSVSH